MALAGTGLAKQTDNTPLQKFLFTFDRYCCCGSNLEYSIVLGKQKYRSWISDYQTDLEAIRHDLESFVFHKKTTLKLFYEDSPTIISLKTERLLNPQTEKERGTGFAWEEVLHISIKPNSFQSKTDKEISGYCNLIDGIDAIYTAFLQCALMAQRNDTDSCEHCWPERTAFYNIIKSPIIEDFLAGREYDPSAPKRRYTPIDVVMDINPDIITSTCNKFTGECGIIYEDIFSAFDNDRTIQDIKVPGMEMWLEEFRDATDFADTTTSPDFDFREWHKRGLAFAQKIRDELVDNCDLWYNAPYEDKSGILLRPKLILKQ